MTARRDLGVGTTNGVTMTDRLLTVTQVAQTLNVGERFVRRLVAERRITFVHVGRHVRIPESAVVTFIEVGTVPSIDRAPCVSTPSLRLVA